jgi:hypothetical protein
MPANTARLASKATIAASKWPRRAPGFEPAQAPRGQRDQTHRTDRERDGDGLLGNPDTTVPACDRRHAGPCIGVVVDLAQSAAAGGRRNKSRRGPPWRRYSVGRTHQGLARACGGVGGT